MLDEEPASWIPSECREGVPKGRKSYCFPYLTKPLYHGGMLLERLGHRRGADDPVLHQLVEHLRRSDTDLRGLAQALASVEESSDVDAVHSRLREAYGKSGNLIQAIELCLREFYDVIWVEQGYGGVYVHSVELVKQLRKRFRVLLIAPEDPLFEEERHEDDLTVPRLREILPAVSYYTYAQVVRAVIATLSHKLLVIGHRSQSVMLFDRVGRVPTIIYCDGFFDGGLRLAEQFHMNLDGADDDRIVDELHYLMRSGMEQFYGLLANPGANLRVLQAAYLAMLRAKENWCWGLRQAEHMTAALPHLRKGIRFEPPFMDPSIFVPDQVDRIPQLLFTTTMHNIERKGLIELCKALQRLPDLKDVRVVLRQPEKAPDIPDDVRVRMTMGSVSKREMIQLYHRVWANCRVSREESSPVSILESMICEVPQIVSPQVAEQIPLIEDGKTGFVVHPDDIDGLVRALKRLMDSVELRDEMGRECRRRALHYGCDSRIGLFEKFLT